VSSLPKTAYQFSTYLVWIWCKSE